MTTTFVTDGDNVFITELVQINLEDITASEAYDFVFTDVWSREIFVLWVNAQTEAVARDCAMEEAPVDPRVEGRFRSGETIEVRDHPDEQWLQRVFVGYRDINGEYVCYGSSGPDTLFSWKLARHIPV